MGPKRRSSETDEPIIRQGRLIKSPPSYIFNKKASWKWRLFKLCRTGLNSFILRYYAYDSLNEEWKGDIHISDVKSIEVGRNSMERIATITRLFNNCPENILCLRTDKRDFYLVDGSAENIAEWQKYLKDAWMKFYQKVTIDGPVRTSASLLTVIPDQEEVMRPKSYPTDYPRTETALVQESNRKRCHTDPDGWNNYREYKDVISEGQESRRHSAAASAQDVISEGEESRRHSAAASAQDDAESCSFSDDMTDPAYGSEQESIYDTPRSIPLKMFEFQESQKEMEAEEESGEEEKESVEEEKELGEKKKESGEEEETSDLESEEGGVYEQMASLVIDEVAHAPSKPPRNMKISPRIRTLERSQVKKVKIWKMMYERSSDSDLVPVTITVPTEHLQKYLGLQEVGDRLCVSRWKGPLHIGCLFHHGDHIESINGFRSGSKDLFFQMLGHCISEEVSLVLKRNTKADVFHLEGCNCESS